MHTTTSTDPEQHFPYARLLENARVLQTHQNEAKNEMEKRTNPVTHLLYIRHLSLSISATFFLSSILIFWIILSIFFILLTGRSLLSLSIIFFHPSPYYVENEQCMCAIY